jgi:hypothetical protein
MMNDHELIGPATWNIDRAAEMEEARARIKEWLQTTEGQEHLDKIRVMIEQLFPDYIHQLD